MAGTPKLKERRFSSAAEDRTLCARGRDYIPEPEPAHIPDGIPDEEREAQELHEVAPPPTPIRRILSPGVPAENCYDPVKKVWRNHVRMTVPHVDCRDHLANERTFLGYLRTSVALSMMGAIVAQLYRLQHSPTPSPIFGYFILSKPIAGILQSSALGMVLLGAIRYFRQQSAMAKGMVHAGGWELLTIVVLMTLLMSGLFALHVALDVTK